MNISPRSRTSLRFQLKKQKNKKQIYGKQGHRKTKRERTPNASLLFEQVRQRIIPFRDSEAILDADVAELYGVKTKEINQAVRNNPEKFPVGYILELNEQEFADLRSKSLTANISPKSRVLPKAFTEKGLYMLATILKSPKAAQVTIAIIETFAMVRQLKRELRTLHSETDDKKQQSKMRHFGEMLSNIIMPD